MLLRVQRLGGLGPIELGKRSVKAFFEDGMMMYAAALAFHALLALFPFAIFLLALLSFLRAPGFFDEVVDQVHTVVPEQAAGQIEKVMGEIRGQTRGGLLSFGIVIAVWSASVGVRALMIALNVAYNVEEPRATWKRYLLSILFTIGLAFMVIVGAGTMFIGPQVAGWVAHRIGLGAAFSIVWAWLHWPVAIFMLMLAVAVVYYLLPNIEEPFRLITPGSVLAVLAWVGASRAFSYYAANFADYGSSYGNLGTAVGLLLYFYVSALALVLGAEVNAEISHASSAQNKGE